METSVSDDLKTDETHCFERHLFPKSDGLTLSSNGVVAWLPLEAQGPGTNRLVVAVSDGVVSITNQWELRVTEVNQVPVPDPVPELSVAQGVLLEVALTARDADVPAQPLDGRLVNAPLGMTVSPSGLLRWKPSTNVATGSYVFRIEWSDGTALGSIPVTVLLKPAIRPPVIVPVPALSWFENVTNSFRLQASPGSGSATNLVWSLVMGPAGLTVSRSGEVQWMPDERSGGTVETVAVVVSDGESAAGLDFQIRVLEDNQPPALTESPRILVRELERLVWFLKVLDPDVPSQPVLLLMRGSSGGDLLSLTGRGVFSHPAGIRAKFDFAPDLFPLLAPNKRSTANDTWLGGQVGFPPHLGHPNTSTAMGVKSTS